MDVQLSFCELRQKEVINVCDGRRLGRIIDLIFDLYGKILGIVVPSPRSFFLWRNREDIFIPWRKIDKIGSDVILVDLDARGHRHDGGYGSPPMPEAYRVGGRESADGGAPPGPSGPSMHERDGQYVMYRSDREEPRGGYDGGYYPEPEREAR